MRRRSTLALLAFTLLGLASAQRRGGGGGGGHGGDSENDDTGGDDDSGSGGGGSGGGETNFRRMPCGWHERQKTFGLPGVYYNGTITIHHHITGSTVWDEEHEEIDGGCDNNDGSPKTYTYPALLLIAPTGNDSDTNPMHWALRAFQPAAQVRAPSNGFIDIGQRWVYVRSSDFIIRNETLRDPDNSALWPLLDTWRDSDATTLNHNTQVYWPTNITSEDDGVYSARAEYTTTPPEMKDGDYRLSLRAYGKYSSQFVTLSDVCIWNQVRTSITNSPEGMPQSLIPEGGTSRRITTPTIWLARGATAELLNIGAESMTMTLNNSLVAAAPRSADREAGCPASDSSPFEMAHFGTIHSRDDPSPSPKPWSVTVSITISFKGNIVRENSTSIDGLENGKILFGTSYDKLLRGMGGVEEEGDDNGSSLIRWDLLSWLSLAVCLLVGIFV